MTLPAGAVLDSTGDRGEAVGDGAGHEFPAARVGLGDLLRPVVGAAFACLGVVEVFRRLFDDLADVVRRDLILVAAHVLMVTDAGELRKS